MRIILHLSDLHFGRTDPALLEPLIRTAAALRPDLVAVSGDLTQRARLEQFVEARKFLERLPSPRIVVAGNHDVPAHNLYDRFVVRLKRYQRYISEDLEPAYADDEIAVAAVNTARSLTLKGGRINSLQAVRLREWLCAFGERVTKIVVTHHPFELPPGGKGAVVGRARMVMRQLSHCGAEVFLAGHLHLQYTASTAVRYRVPGAQAALIVQAGTATSTRGRGEPNSFNVLRIERPEIAVERMTWDAARGVFALTSEERFRRTEEGWIRA